MLQPFQDRQQTRHRNTIRCKSAGQGIILRLQLGDLFGQAALLTLQPLDARGGGDQLLAQVSGLRRQRLAFRLGPFQHGTIFRQLLLEGAKLLLAGRHRGQAGAGQSVAEIHRQVWCCRMVGFQRRAGMRRDRRTDKRRAMR